MNIDCPNCDHVLIVPNETFKETNHVGLRCRKCKAEFSMIFEQTKEPDPVFMKDFTSSLQNRLQDYNCRKCGKPLGNDLTCSNCP